jgi:hypothetical protein
LVEEAEGGQEGSYEGFAGGSRYGTGRGGLVTSIGLMTGAGMLPWKCELCGEVECFSDGEGPD